MNCLDGISCCSVVASSTNAQKSGSMAHLTASARRRLKRNAMVPVSLLSFLLFLGFFVSFRSAPG
eukprot:m.394331 g.394331  ORF g.394331 m.394331 type:complete len:65 (-) comp56371_c0_seq24:56-250(-)